LGLNPSRRSWLAWSGLIVLAALVRRRLLTRGAGSEERVAHLPSDDLVTPADLAATRAISVRAPAAAVWPWIAQMGQDRGGLYSYDALENLLGCDMHSAPHR
jgi:hypothetical protein